jgi:hypothetical protein
MNRDLYPDDPDKREDVYNTYKKYLGNVSHFARFESLIPATMKNTVFWYVTPHNLKFTDIFEECTASVFKAGEYAKHGNSGTDVGWRKSSE